LARRFFEFWATHEDQFPIWTRICSRIAPNMACSTDVERYFKITKRVCADQRDHMSPYMINILSTLYMWLVEEKEHRDGKADKREELNSRFITLSRDLQMVVPLNSDIDTDVSDDDVSDSDKE